MLKEIHSTMIITSTHFTPAYKGLSQHSLNTSQPTTEPGPQAALPQDSISFSQGYQPHPLKAVCGLSAFTFMGGLGGLAVGLLSGNGDLAFKSGVLAAGSMVVGMTASSQFQ